MMFSCLNRREISEKNPGLHASQITKLLGHEWRQMSAEQQSPYRRKASHYVKEILAKTYATEQ
ncbi:hypothetical protein LSH36_605g00012 [Paralvinella palmiformis]|uniref:HMG box domain-containing protein n=1 Tax=Paralvinella palmiformis TaxID=53620 RepID=A0AAD9J5G1_9ANNE|nr:hypothetical protein LSH36_605g00012 [Paralvinella palmiformis]